MINLEKQLKDNAAKEKNKLSSDSAVKEFLLLEDDNAKQDKNIMLKLGNNSHLAIANEEKGKVITLEKYENVFDGAIFTRDQIKALAIKYDLRFLSTRIYTGSYTRTTAAKIRNFAEFANKQAAEGNFNSKKIAVDLSSELHDKFFILAPVECFQTKTKIVEYTRFEVDPLLFYQIDSNHYKLVDKWGVDLSIWRLLQGFKWRSWWHCTLYNMLTYLPFVVVLGLLIFSTTFILSDTFWFSVLVLLFTFGITCIRGIEYLRDGSQITGYFGSHKWDSDEKIERR